MTMQINGLINSFLVIVQAGTVRID
jgi:hypothetical protein